MNDSRCWRRGAERRKIRRSTIYRPITVGYTAGKMSQISQYLVEALNAELSCRIKHERQVAYILLLIRKLLETERYKRQDASFWILSDWVVHSRMDRNQWIDELTDVAHKMIDLSQVTYDKLGVREQ
jgi:hypothetical protein